MAADASELLSERTVERWAAEVNEDSAKLKVIERKYGRKNAILVRSHMRGGTNEVRKLWPEWPDDRVNIMAAEDAMFAPTKPVENPFRFGGHHLPAYVQRMTQEDHTSLIEVVVAGAKRDADPEPEADRQERPRKHARGTVEITCEEV